MVLRLARRELDALLSRELVMFDRNAGIICNLAARAATVPVYPSDVNEGFRFMLEFEAIVARRRRPQYSVGTDRATLATRAHPSI